MADETPDQSAPAPAPSQAEPAAPPPPVQQAAPSEPEAPPPPANLGTQRIHAGLPEGTDVLRLVDVVIPNADPASKDETRR
jgi:hypothetical protein